MRVCLSLLALSLSFTSVLFAVARAGMFVLCARIESSGVHRWQSLTESAWKCLCPFREARPELSPSLAGGLDVWARSHPEPTDRVSRKIWF